MADRPSVPKQLFEKVKANLSSLFEGGDRALKEFSDDELAEELQRREAKKLREEDERRAAEREELEAKRRAAARRSAEVEKREKDKTRPSSGPTRTTTSSTSARSSSSSRFSSSAGKQSAPPPRSPAAIAARKLQESYATLEVPMNAPFDEVKSAYRRLMRKYHPDLHLADPKKHKAATAVSMQLTDAYKLIEAHLKKK